VIISILDTCTAFLAGFVIFATIGFMAAETASTIDEVVTKGAWCLDACVIIIIIIIITNENVYVVVIVTQSLREFTRFI